MKKMYFYELCFFILFSAIFVFRRKMTSIFSDVDEERINFLCSGTGSCDIINAIRNCHRRNDSIII